MKLIVEEMGQYLSLQSLVQVAFGRPYIDVFEVEEEEEEEDAKKVECEERNERVQPTVVLRLSKNQVRRTVRFEE